MSDMRAALLAGYIPGDLDAFVPYAPGKMRLHKPLVQAVEKVGDVISDGVDWVVDKVIDPVMTTVSNVIDSALSDPVKAIAQIAAIATQQYWALPLIEGASVAAHGGDLSDVLEATAKAYVMQEVGNYVGKAAGAYAGEAAAGAQYGTSGSQAAMLAAQEAGMGTASAIASNVIGAAAGSAAVAVVAGKDPVQAFFSGGVGAAVPAALGQVSGFQQLPGAAQRVISSAVTAQLTGQNVTAATVTAAVAASGLVTEMLKSFDPSGTKLDNAQRAIITDVLMGTATAAITGGNPSNVVRAAMLKAGSAALGSMVTDTFKDATTAASTAYKKADDKTTEILANETAQKTAVAKYNEYATTVQSKINEQTGLKKAYDDAVAAYNENPSQTTVDAANAAAKKYNDFVTSFNKYYGETLKPGLDKYGSEIDTLKQTHATLTGDYEKLIQSFATKTDSLSGVLDPLFYTTNRAFVEAMNPGFNADEYRKLNGLGADVDVYEHFLGEGQFKGLPINNDAAKALANGDASGTAVDKSTGTVAADKVFDGSQYASSAAAQKAAAAMGMTYFKAPDGNTYQILSDAESKAKIKSAATFGEAFTMARKTLGSGATFEWTNPDTGKTSSFTTQTKEEAAASANAGSLVKVNDAVTTYVTDKILSNVTDYKNFNPADLTKAEYKQFIGAYLNATDSQRQQMLKGADQMTFGVIANVLKEAPDAIKAQATAPAPFVSVGSIKASDYTNYLQVIKTGVDTAASDITGVAVRGLQLLGKSIGADTPTLNSIQDLLTTGKDTQMSKLVGNEKVIAGGIASGIESAMSWFVGGPIGSLASLGAVAANNAWIEGSNAVIDAKGNAYNSAAEAKAAGVFTYRNLTTEENAMRTAVMTSLEIAGESVGIPGMSKLMKGIPIGQGVDALVAGVKRSAVGLGNEQVSELLTTTAQMAADKFTSFGLNQNATWSDYAKALQDTALATTVAVGTSGSIATAVNNMRTAATVVRDESAVNVTPLTYNSVVAKDATGQNVTLAELLTANSIANFADPNANADLAKLTPVADLRSVVSLGDMNVKLGDLLNGTQAVASTTDVLTESAVAEIFRASNFIPDDNTVKGFVGAPASNTTFTNINKFVDNNKLDAKEAIEIAKKEGITLTEAQAQQYVQQGDEAALSAALAAKLDPTSTTYDEAKAFFTQRGYVPTFEEVNQFVGVKAEADQSTAVGAYVNPRQVTYDEAKKYLTDLGYNPTDAEVKRFVGQVNEAQQAGEIGEYVDPRMVDEGEVKAAYEALGLKKPTQADVQKLIGQYAESDLAGKAQANLDPARYNSIMEQLDGLTTGASQEVLDAVALVKKDLNSQITALGGDIATLSGDVATAKADLLGAIKDAQTGNTERFGDIDKAIQDLKDAGLSEKQVQDIVDKSTTGLSKDFKDALAEAVKGNADALTKVQEDLTTKIGDVQTALETALGDQKTAFNAKVQDLMDQGKTYQEATETALKDIGVQITDLGTDFATKLKDTSDALGKQIGDLSTKLSDVERNLLEKIADNEKAGLSRDEATQKAVADLATELGTTKEDLLKQIGTTETALKEQVSGVESSLGTKITESQEAILKELGLAKTGLSEEIAATKEQLGTQIGDVETNILNRVDQYEKAGISRDEALGLAINDVATQLGTTKEDILSQIGQTEKALSDRIGQTETKLGTQIGTLQNVVGQNTQQVTQADIDLITRLEQQGAYDARLDYNNDQKIDINDRTALENALKVQQGIAVDSGYKFQPGTGTKWAPTGIFGQMATDQAATQKAIADAQAAAAADAEKTRQAAARNALNQVRLGNVNSMMSMLSQAPDTGGQQVTVKAADPSKIGYIYDWSSIFANPSQEKMFASPYGAYAQGGVVRDEVDDVNDELLKILRG